MVDSLALKTLFAGCLCNWCVNKKTYVNAIVYTRRPVLTVIRYTGRGFLNSKCLFAPVQSAWTRYIKDASWETRTRRINRTSIMSVTGWTYPPPNLCSDMHCSCIHIMKLGYPLIGIISCLWVWYLCLLSQCKNACNNCLCNNYSLCNTTACVIRNWLLM